MRGEGRKVSLDVCLLAFHSTYDASTRLGRRSSSPPSQTVADSILHLSSHSPPPRSPISPPSSPSLPRNRLNTLPSSSSSSDLELDPNHEPTDLLVENPNHQGNMWGAPRKANKAAEAESESEEEEEEDEDEEEEVGDVSAYVGVGDLPSSEGEEQDEEEEEEGAEEKEEREAVERELVGGLEGLGVGGEEKGERS
ncbi:hypothetical protein BDY24DRAFT_195478 [Mrakia frigida]|uniref:uncharacterized protein n=1 Tax=Mrakia frigida TaxID=29902 RepID=UPI003FCBF721